MTQALPPYEVGRLAGAVLDSVGSVLVGKRDSLELVLAGILAGGHVLLEDMPGLGKTLTARSFAQALGLDFRRLQFTPDLLPADVTGSFLYDQRKGDFAFRAGPVFTNMLLADEINRTPPSPGTRTPSSTLTRRSRWGIGPAPASPAGERWS